MILVLALFFREGEELWSIGKHIFCGRFAISVMKHFMVLFFLSHSEWHPKSKVQRNIIILYVIMTFGNWVTIFLFLGVFWNCSDVSLTCGHETLTVLPISHCFLTYVEDCKESISISNISIRSRHWCIFSTLASIGKALLIPDYFMDIMKLIK